MKILAIPHIKPDNPIMIPPFCDSNIKAVFTTKSGDPKQEGNLEKYLYENSKKPELILSRLVSGYPLNQIHSNTIYKYRDWFLGRNGDGMFTNKKFLPCIVNVADCIPILIRNKKGTEVCAVHAGWRGLKKDIIKKAIQLFSDGGEKLEVWIGPSIGYKSYEIQENFINDFPELNHHYKSCVQSTGQKFFCDLNRLANIQLHDAKVKDVKRSERCVFEEAQSFYSHRREKTKNRMSAIIWIE